MSFIGPTFDAAFEFDGYEAAVAETHDLAATIEQNFNGLDFAPGSRNPATFINPTDGSLLHGMLTVQYPRYFDEVAITIRDSIEFALSLGPDNVSFAEFGRAQFKLAESDTDAGESLLRNVSYRNPNQQESNFLHCSGFEEIVQDQDARAFLQMLASCKLK